MIVTLNAYPRLEKLVGGLGLLSRLEIRLPLLESRMEFTLEKVLPYYISYGVQVYARERKIRMCKMLSKMFMARCPLNTMNCYAAAHGNSKLIQ